MSRSHFHNYQLCLHERKYMINNGKEEKKVYYGDDYVVMIYCDNPNGPFMQTRTIRHR